MGQNLTEFSLKNCYLDTSYQERDGSITISKLVEGGTQTNELHNDLTIVANDGFTLSPEFKFKYKHLDYGDYQDNTEWEEIDNTMFMELEGDLNLELDFDRGDYKFKGLDIDKSLVYTSYDMYGYVNCYIFLIGGFNPDKLVFARYENDRYSDSTYNGKPINMEWFSFELVDELGTPLEEYETMIDGIVFSADSDNPPEPDITEGVLNTYYIESKTFNEIRESGEIPKEVILNTYNYPIKFPEESLIDVNLKIGSTGTTVKGKTFNSNITNVDLFLFDVPDIPEVNECYIRIPFNNNVDIPYEDIRGKKIRGYISYEMLTNTTTLIITDEVETLYKNVMMVGVRIPYNPLGEINSISPPDVRLSNEVPKLFIKGLKTPIKSNYIKGSIDNTIDIMLKEEINIINELLNKGVFINDNR